MTSTSWRVTAPLRQARQVPRKVKDFVRYRVVGAVRRNPVVAAIAVGAVALLGPRRIWELGARAITLYTLLRR